VHFDPSAGRFCHPLFMPSSFQSYHEMSEEVSGLFATSRRALTKFASYHTVSLLASQVDRVFTGSKSRGDQPDELQCSQRVEV